MLGLSTQQLHSLTQFQDRDVAHCTGCSRPIPTSAGPYCCECIPRPAARAKEPERRQAAVV